MKIEFDFDLETWTLMQEHVLTGFYKDESDFIKQAIYGVTLPGENDFFTDEMLKNARERFKQGRPQGKSKAAERADHD